MRTIISILILAQCIFLQVFAQYINWAERGGSAQIDRGQAIHTDNRGYSALTGSFFSSMTLGSVNVTGGSGHSVFIAQADSMGQILWARASTGSGNAYGLGVTRDGSGNVLVTGYFNGSVTLGTTTLNSTGNDDIFVAKYSSTGTFLWAISAGGTSVDQGFALTADASGNVFVTGYATGTCNFGSLSISAAFYDAFLVKYNSSGIEQWVRKGGGASTDYGRGVALDASGNIYLAGDIYGTGNCTFGSITVNGAGAYDAFLAKYDNTGTEQWVRTGGGALNDRATAATTDPSGNVLITGFFSSAVSFSSNNLNSIGDQDIFVAKYNNAGALQWIRQAGGNLSYNAGYGIVTDNSSSVYVTGTFQNTIAFGPLSMQSLGLDPFVAKYTSGGTPVWIQRAGSGQDDEGKGIGVDTSGRAYVAGWFVGNNSPFGVHTLTNAGVEDIFYMRLDSGIVTLNPTNLVYCAGDSIYVPYQAFGDFLPLNNFTAELSDANGSFALPTTLGILSGQQSSTVSGRIPTGTVAGTGYRVRVNGSLNAATGRINTVNITIKALPATPTPSVSGLACAGSSLQLTVNSISGASWSWAGPNSFTSAVSGPVINPAGTIHSGVYSVRATVNGCTGSYGTVNVSVTALPTGVSAGNNSPFCSGNTLNLTAPTYGGVSYFWQGPGGFTSGVQNPSITNALPSNAGLYSLQVHTSGCSTQVVTTSVSINTTPAAPTAGATQVVLCTGDNLNLTATIVPGAGYVWSGPSGFASTMQNPVINNVTTGQAGTYSVYTQIGSCNSPVSTVSIIINSGPPSVMAGSNSPLCEFSALNLMAGNITGGTYNWVGPNGFTSSQQNPVINPVTLTDAGVYTLTVNNGCASTQSLVTVNVIPAPASPVASSNSPLCVGNPLTLKATTVTNATYFWQGPTGFTSTTQNPIIQPVLQSDSGIYSVYAIVNGCTSQVSVTHVIVNSASVPPAISGNTPVCEGGSLQLSCTTPATSYQWDGPGGWSSSAQNPVINPVSLSASGVYSCFIQDGGCTSPTGTVTVVVNPIPATPVISLSGDTLFSSSGSGNQWYSSSSGIISGATQNWYVPTGGGGFYVIVTQNGCSSDTSGVFVYVGIGEEIKGENGMLNIYPNPVRERIRITAEAEFELEGLPVLWDVKGKIVGAIRAEGDGWYSLPLGTPSGVYVIEVPTVKGSLYSRLVIE